MKNKILLSIIILTTTALSAAAQGVAINTDGSTPDASAGLDVKFTNHGMLIPRVALTGTADVATITNGNVVSLLVYNTATGGGVSPGYYYWDGSGWLAFMGDGGKDWGLTGNSGTTAGTNFLGSLDYEDLVFRVGSDQANATEVILSGSEHYAIQA